MTPAERKALGYPYTEAEHDRLVAADIEQNIRENSRASMLADLARITAALDKGASA